MANTINLTDEQVHIMTSAILFYIEETRKAQELCNRINPLGHGASISLANTDKVAQSLLNILTSLNYKDVITAAVAAVNETSEDTRVEQAYFDKNELHIVTTKHISEGTPRACDYTFEPDELDGRISEGAHNVAQVFFDYLDGNGYDLTKVNVYENETTAEL